MESEGLEDHEEVGGHASWTSAMSAFMLAYLANIVATGTRTSSGFKKCHLSSCAKTVNEKYNTARSGDQRKNHLKTWQRKFAKISRLMKLSGAGWDEKNYIITLDPEHYNNYVKDHKCDVEFLNKPIENFSEMAIIFGNSMATSKSAKDSSSAPGTDQVENEEEGHITHEEVETPSTANRRAKNVENDDNELIEALKFSSVMIAKAIEKASMGNMDLPNDLFDRINELPGFDDTHKSFYYAYLVENPHIGRAFYNLPLEHRLNFFAKWITEKFSGQI